jgi:hypothetical protein
VLRHDPTVSESKLKFLEFVATGLRVGAETSFCLLQFQVRFLVRLFQGGVLAGALLGLLFDNLEGLVRGVQHDGLHLQLALSRILLSCLATVRLQAARVVLVQRQSRRYGFNL